MLTLTPPGADGFRRREASALRATWARPRTRAVVYQSALLLLLVAGAVYVVANVRRNLPRLNMQFGWDFLAQPASFEIGDNPVGFVAGQSVFRAFLAGIANTLKVAIVGIIGATALGAAIGVARLSRNWLVVRTAWLYVETVRNLPLLLQLLFWHTFITATLPPPRDAWHPLPGLFLSNRGVVLPGLVWDGGLRLEWPSLVGFNFQGGLTVTPEFAAILLGLVIYSSAFVAETVRGGILGVRRGQVEAARALGLAHGQVLRWVVFPQALRIMVPPLTSSYLSLTKNSSLGVAVAYSEVVRVATLVAADLAHPIECVAVVMGVYLTLSLLTAAFMSWYDRRIAFEEA
jgi:general L-amino acid transport system permease protein